MLLRDGVRAHPKVLKAGAEAAWLWACCIDYSRSQLTDGVVPDEALPTLANCRSKVDVLVQRLVDVGLLHRLTGGVQVHDYLEHNDSAEAVREAKKRDADRKRGRVSGVESETTPNGFQAESMRNPNDSRARVGVGVGKSVGGGVGVGVPSDTGSLAGAHDDVVETVAASWPEWQREATGVLGRFRPAHDVQAVMDLVDRYRSEPDVPAAIKRRAVLMWRSDRFAHLTRNPKLLIELAPELDRHLLDHGDEMPIGAQPTAMGIRGSRTQGNHASLAAFAARGAQS